MQAKILNFAKKPKNKQSDDGVDENTKKVCCGETPGK